MTRTTKADIYNAVKTINNLFGHRDYYLRVHVEWAYGRPRAYLYDMNGNMHSELSPRLSTGPLLDWLHAFLKGLHHGYATH